MTIVKQGDNYILTGVTLSHLMAIANAMNAASNDGKLTLIGQHVLSPINDVIKKDSKNIG